MACVKGQGPTEKELAILKVLWAKGPLLFACLIGTKGVFDYGTPGFNTIKIGK
ncbi:MAG: hypothetical protein ACYSUT_10100 [Planctomycetota bacterium]